MSFFGAAPVNFAGPSLTTLTPGSNDPELGTRIHNAGNSYVWVYNAGNSQLSPGYLGVLSGTSGYSITISSVTGVDVPIGIVKHSTFLTASYGWLLSRGYSQVQMGANDSAAVGSLLGVGVNGVVALKSNSTGFPCDALGQAREAIASGASGTGYICIS